MARKVRSGKAAVQSFQSTTPAPKQQHFDPVRRTVSTRRTPATVPRTKQQTLTQIDFVPRPELDDDMELEYEYETPQPRKKRRKTTHGTPALARNNTLTQINFITRRSFAQEDEDDLDYLSADNMEQTEELNNGDKAEIESGKSAGEAKARGSRRRPAIPAMSRRSTRSKTAIHQETSTIPSPQLMPPPRTPRKIFKREILSSQSPESSPLSAKSPSPRKRVTPRKTRAPLGEVAANIRSKAREASDLSPSKKSRKTPLLKVEDTFDPSSSSSISMQQKNSDPSEQTTKHVTKLEIMDSDEELEDEDLDFTSGPPADVNENESHKIQVLNDATPSLPSIVSNTSSAVGSAVNTGSVLPEAATTHIPASLGHPPPLPPLTRSDSADVSAQLLSDLTRYTQPEPSSIRIDDEFDSDQYGDPTLPTNPPIPATNSFEERPRRALVPTSQASTVPDGSQSSARSRTPGSSARTAPTSVMRKALDTPTQGKDGNEKGKNVETDEYELPSSPVVHRHRKQTPEWNRTRLTDSQLLPDSIMNFALPPMSSQDNLHSEH